MPHIRIPDIANLASKLPAPLQKPAGMAMEGLRQVFGDIPLPATTAVGPVAGEIPQGVKTLVNMLKSKLPKPNLNATALGSRVSSVLPPTLPKVTPPEGFEFGSGMRQMVRAPEVKQATAQIDPFYSQFRSGRPGPRTVTSLQTTPEVEALQQETAPAIKGLESLSDVSRSVTPTPASGPVKSIRVPSSGRSSTGYSKSSNKVNEQVVKEIRDLSDNAVPVKHLLIKYPNLKEATIRDIINRNSWNWVK